MSDKPIQRTKKDPLACANPDCNSVAIQWSMPLVRGQKRILRGTCETCGTAFTDVDEWVYVTSYYVKPDTVDIPEIKNLGEKDDKDDKDDGLEVADDAEVEIVGESEPLKEIVAGSVNVGRVVFKGTYECHRMHRWVGLTGPGNHCMRCPSCHLDTPPEEGTVEALGIR
jgi:hypothetical protein